MNTLIDEYIRKGLGLPEKGQARRIDLDESDLAPDLAIETPEGLIVAMVENRADIPSLSRLCLASQLLRGTEGRVIPVMAAKSFSDRTKVIAERAGIRTVTLPRSVQLDRRPREGKGPTPKLTSAKAWRVVATLIGQPSASIRSIALKAGVSYGWAYAVCMHLLDTDLARRKGNRVVLEDVDRLLSGAAWERPLKALMVDEFRTDMDDVFGAAREISGMLSDNKQRHAFAGYLAGALYTGHAVRFDMVQLYIPMAEASTLREIYSNDVGGGITVQVLVPDRDVYSESRRIEGIQTVSPAQALLDLAGVGAGALDMSKALVRSYADL